MNARDHVSDADVLTAVRDSLSGMPLASPPDVETIMARGRRTRRHRRLIPGVSGTLAVAAGAALAVVLAEASRPLTSAQNKVTCAWPFEKVDAATEAPSRRSSAARAEWRITLRDEHGSGPRRASSRRSGRFGRGDVLRSRPVRNRRFCGHIHRT